MTVGFFVNPERDSGLVYTQTLKDFLIQSGHITPDVYQNTQKTGLDCHMDFIIVLGGDGTMLRAAQFSAPKGIPLLGINLGNVGFLTHVNKENGLKALEKVLSGFYRLEKRMMLVTENKPALNDIVLKGDKLTRFNVKINGRFLYEARADGIIVATPTGSTAYSRSAGGPLLMCQSEMTAVTPICPGDPTVRPWVLEGSTVVTVSADQRINITVDGEKVLTKNPGETVTIKPADYSASIIHIKD
jgi:NAD+ kinase